jgi:hypothetical protein
MLLPRLFLMFSLAAFQDWSLNELLGVCSIMNIPFVVIVQPHMLKDKGSVRLRRVLPDDIEIGWHTGSGSGNEVFVPLEALATTIREMSVETPESDEWTAEEPRPEGLTERSTSSRDPAIARSSTARVECVYVEQDQYFYDDSRISKQDTPHYKGVMKTIKSVAQRSESYLANQVNSASRTPVFGVSELPFWVLRDFGTCLMRRERKEQSAVGASAEVTERYPKGKRALKTLAMAIDNFMKRRGVWDQNSSRSSANSSGGSQLLTVLLYSKLDDRFDMVSLEGGSGPSNNHNSASSRRK